jgi:hypothetical protein
MPLFAFLMNGTIAFDSQASFVTVEIRDVIANLMLSSELKTEQSTISKQLPQQTLSGCLAPAKVTSERC